MCSFSLRPRAPPGAKPSPWQAQGEQGQGLSSSWRGSSWAGLWLIVPWKCLQPPWLFQIQHLCCAHAQGREAQPTGSTFSAWEGIKTKYTNSCGSATQRATQHYCAFLSTEQQLMHRKEFIQQGKQIKANSFQILRAHRLPKMACFLFNSQKWAFLLQFPLIPY